MTKNETKEFRLRWRKLLAAGCGGEMVVAGDRSLTGYPTPEAAAAVAEAVDGAPDTTARVYVVSLEEQARRAGLAAVPAEWSS